MKLLLASGFVLVCLYDMVRPIRSLLLKLQMQRSNSCKSSNWRLPLLWRKPPPKHSRWKRRKPLSTNSPLKCAILPQHILCVCVYSFLLFPFSFFNTKLLLVFNISTFHVFGLCSSMFYLVVFCFCLNGFACGTAGRSAKRKQSLKSSGVARYSAGKASRCERGSFNGASISINTSILPIH